VSLDDKGGGWDEQRYPQAGDWVQVWGQVRRGETHPEDVLVEFFSHSEQWAGHVRTDRVVWTPGEAPDFVYQCTRLHLTANDALRRCIKHDGHGGKHRDNRGTKFTDDEVAGYIEEA
jgi:molybdenum cofactor biosynthesis enzyme MoaA